MGASVCKPSTSTWEAEAVSLGFKIQKHPEMEGRKDGQREGRDSEERKGKAFSSPFFFFFF